MSENIKLIIKKLESWFLWFWIKNSKVSILFIFLIFVLWLFSAYSIPKKSSPDLDFWIIVVSKPYIWVNPEDIDSLITTKIENAVKDLTWIKKISSTSSLWVWSVVLELENGVDVDTKISQIRSNLDQERFPSDAEKTIIQDISSKDNRLFSIAMFAPAWKYDKTFLTNKAIKLKEDLERSPWVNKVIITSWSDYEIKISFDKSALESIWLNLFSLSSLISEHNKSIPLWNHKVWDLYYDFRFDWDKKELNEFLNIPLKNINWSIVYLKDVAKIEKSYKNTEINKIWFKEKSWFDAIFIDVEKKDTGDLFKASDLAKKAFTEINKTSVYKWLEFEIYNDTSKIMLDDYKSLFTNMSQTFVLVFLILALFVWFKEWLIAVSIVIMSYLITFIVLKNAWLSLNFLTNFSLIISLWVAVDTIIVIIEATDAKIKLWYTPKHATLFAVRDFAAPIISWTMTTVVAFIPLLTLPWIMWKFLSYIPITVFITLLASLFLALTVTPVIMMLLSKNPKFYRENKNEESVLSQNAREILEFDREWKALKVWEEKNIRDKFLNKLSSLYDFFLKKVIKRKLFRLLSIFLPIVLLFVTFNFWIWFKLFPESDNPYITAELESRAWVKSKELTKDISELDKVFKWIDELKLYTITTSANTITVSVELLETKVRQKRKMLDVFAVEKIINKNLDRFKTRWYNVSTSVRAGWPPGVAPVWIKLQAKSTKDFDTLRKVAKDFSEYIKTIPWTKNVEISSKETPWQFIFKLKYDEISRLWLNPNQVLNTVLSYTYWLWAWSLRNWSDSYDIKIKIDDFNEKLSATQIESIVIPTQKWNITLKDVCDVVFDQSTSQITRVDTKVVIEVSSYLEQWILPTSIQPQLIEFAQKYNYPNWISFQNSWETEENSDLIISTMIAFFVAVFLIFTILVLQFNSFAKPLIIIYSVALALLWVNVWLILMWLPYSMAFAIWFIALTWIVVNNAIIYIDKLNINLREWMEKHYAVVEAWVSRLNPMLVTTITTVLWLLPTALQDKFWAWLWFTIIFGLISWTIMTLFVIPSLYYEVFLREKKLKLEKRKFNF